MSRTRKFRLHRQFCRTPRLVKKRASSNRPHSQPIHAQTAPRRLPPYRRQSGSAPNAHQFHRGHQHACSLPCRSPYASFKSSELGSKLAESCVRGSVAAGHLAPHRLGSASRRREVITERRASFPRLRARRRVRALKCGGEALHLPLAIPLWDHANTSSTAVRPPHDSHTTTFRTYFASPSSDKIGRRRETGMVNVKEKRCFAMPLEMPYYDNWNICTNSRAITSALDLDILLYYQMGRQRKSYSSTAPRCAPPVSMTTYTAVTFTKYYCGDNADMQDPPRGDQEDGQHRVHHVARGPLQQHKERP